MQTADNDSGTLIRDGWRIDDRFTSAIRRLGAPLKSHVTNERRAKPPGNQPPNPFKFFREPLVDDTRRPAEQVTRPTPQIAASGAATATASEPASSPF